MMVEKINSEPEDRHPDGTRGKVVGSLGIGYYFIAWDEKPEARWFVPETKIRRLRKKKQDG
jgi:hypothetical protein